MFEKPRHLRQVPSVGVENIEKKKKKRRRRGICERLKNLRSGIQYRAMHFSFPGFLFFFLCARGVAPPAGIVVFFLCFYYFDSRARHFNKLCGQRRRVHRVHRLHGATFGQMKRKRKDGETNDRLPRARFIASIK